MAFGDLFLEDIRAYREAQLAGTGLETLFPLWGRDTTELAREMMGAGLRAHVACIDPGKLPLEAVGKPWDEAWLGALPAGIDPCGENGEFHTFVHDGPMFDEPVRIRTGERVERDGFAWCDLLPESGTAPA
jgi:diphthamide synthase (EF-2-diphthine--ammonia ligase)